jgi:hypothetical protein
LQPVLGGSSSRQSAEEEKLIAALSVPEETQCVDTKAREIATNLAFTNNSATDIILRRGLGQNMTVLGLFGTKTLSPLLRSWSSEYDAGPRSQTTEVTIHPGTTIAYSMPLKLDADVLKQPGFYKIQVSYDAKTATQPNGLIGRSNWVIIQVRECEASITLNAGDGR